MESTHDQTQRLFITQLLQKKKKELKQRNAGLISRNNKPNIVRKVGWQTVKSMEQKNSLWRDSAKKDKRENVVKNIYAEYEIMASKTSILKVYININIKGRLEQG